MDRNTASTFLREELNKHGLNKWSIRISSDPDLPFLGLCMHGDKVIMLNAHHIDIHPYKEVVCTIKHEVAHALTPGHGHDSVWEAKAREIGCDNTQPCSHLSLPPHIIDAIRSGHTVEVITEEKEVVQVIRNVTHKVTRLQDKCPDCGKVAKEKFSYMTVDKQGNQVKMITLECFHIIKKVIPKGTPFQELVSNWWKPEVKSCKHVFTKNKCDGCGEFKLFEFQVTGARFIEAACAIQKGAGLFDDMGLGKTVQILAYLRYHPERYPVLYVVKSAIKFNWFKQIVRWHGPDYLAQVINTSKDAILPGLKSYIISYDLLKRFPTEKLAKLGLKTVVLDECQQIKNPDSSRTQEVRKLVKDTNIKVLPLSGTPWKNRGEEFFPVLNMLSPTKFYSHQHYLDTWVDFYWEGNKKKQGGIRNPKKFREYVQDIVIRREYNEVMDEFPDINRTKLAIQLDEFSQTTYDDATSEFVAWYNQFVIDGTEDSLNGIEILAKMSRMRHITGLAKIPATMSFAEEFIEDTDKKLVIFFHHKDVGRILFDGLCERYQDENHKEFIEKIPVLKIIAEMSDAERFEAQELFNKLPRAIMVASTLASGEGIDLQTCSDSVMHERQWNPQNEDQAAPGRFRRIGQLSKQINITFTEGEGTIDGHLDEIVERKRRHFHAVMNKGEQPKWNEGDIGKEMAKLIIAKHKAKHGSPAKPTNVTAAATLIRRA